MAGGVCRVPTTYCMVRGNEYAALRVSLFVARGRFPVFLVRLVITVGEEGGLAYVCTVPGCFCARQLKDYSTCLEGQPASLPNSLPVFLCGVDENGEVGTFVCVWFVVERGRSSHLDLSNLRLIS
jgi:hypothetical protein